MCHSFSACFSALIKSIFLKVIDINRFQEVSRAFGSFLIPLSCSTVRKVKMGKFFGAIFCVILAAVNAEFELQYIGDKISSDAAQQQNFCDSEYCLSDSHLLFYAATQNASVDPCLDFKEFSMGSLIKYRALHERYFSIGLLADTKRLHEERQRKLLASKRNLEKDHRVFKAMKNFFRKCVDSSK